MRIRLVCDTLAVLAIVVGGLAGILALTSGRLSQVEFVLVVIGASGLGYGTNRVILTPLTVRRKTSIHSKSTSNVNKDH